jgi:hypothetical protein
MNMLIVKILMLAAIAGLAFASLMVTVLRPLEPRAHKSSTMHEVRRRPF